MTAPLPCPCCGCRTLPSHGTYDICPVCFWEDDFTVDPENDLNPNNMCLFDARANLAAWGAVEPEFVHWTRPPTADEAPEGYPHRGERPYDRWPTLPVGDGVRFGWIGPASPAGPYRDGFLVLDDGRRAGLRIRVVGDRASVRAAERIGRGRDGQFDVDVAEEDGGTGDVLRALRGGLAGEIVALLPRPWSPDRRDLGTSRTYGGGGHGDVRWEASSDDVDRVAAWALEQLRTAAQPGDELVALGPRSWVVRRTTSAGLSISGAAVHDATGGPLPPGVPAGLPPGTRCLLEWSSGSFPAPPSPPPPPPPPSRSRWWGGG